MLVLRRIDLRRVVCSVEPEECDVNNPDTVEVHEQVGRGALLKEGLEEDAVPGDATKLCVPLCRRDVDQARLQAARLGYTLE